MCIRDRCTAAVAIGVPRLALTAGESAARHGDEVIDAIDGVVDAAPTSSLNDVERLFDNLDDDVVFHYTTESGLDGIADLGRIVPGDSGYVYVTQDMLTSDEAFTHLFAGNPGFTGRGDSIVAFRVDPGLRLTPGSQPNELFHQLSLIHI